MADQEFKETYNPKERHIPISLLKGQVDELSEKLDEEIEQASEKEDYETANLLTKLKREMDLIAEETENLTSDDVTDKRYQLDDKKRKLAQEIDSATKNKRLQLAKEHYENTKADCLTFLQSTGNDHEWKAYNDIVSQEEIFMSTNSPLKIQEKSDELYGIIHQLRWRTPAYLIDIFNWLKGEQPRMNDQPQAKSLLDAGKFAIESENWNRLREIDYGLLDLLPRGSKEHAATKIGFGI